MHWHFYFFLGKVLLHDAVLKKKNVTFNAQIILLAFCLSSVLTESSAGTWFCKIKIKSIFNNPGKAYCWLHYNWSVTCTRLLLHDTWCFTFNAQIILLALSTLFKHWMFPIKKINLANLELLHSMRKKSTKSQFCFLLILLYFIVMQ